jgi:hypothetical protein
MNPYNHRNGLLMIAIGFVMVIAGAVLPFLMVQHILRSTLFLNFLAFAVSISGLFLGLVGAAMNVRVQRGKSRDR